MRSIRMLSALSARHRSSVRLVMRLYLMPASGLNSKVVTTGPGLICVTCPWTSNSEYFSVSTWASNFNSSASIACCSSGRCSRLLGGNLKPPAAMRGMVVFGFAPVSARSVTSTSGISASGAWSRLRLDGVLLTRRPGRSHAIDAGGSNRLRRMTTALEPQEDAPESIEL